MHFTGKLNNFKTFQHVWIECMCNKERERESKANLKKKTFAYNDLKLILIAIKKSNIEDCSYRRQIEREKNPLKYQRGKVFSPHARYSYRCMWMCVWTRTKDLFLILLNLKQVFHSFKMIELMLYIYVFISTRTQMLIYLLRFTLAMLLLF